MKRVPAAYAVDSPIGSSCWAAMAMPGAQAALLGCVVSGIANTSRTLAPYGPAGTVRRFCYIL